MAILDRREPATYVTIEDHSYVAPVLESGRTVYAATVCDRGPHRRIVPIHSLDEFRLLFGKANYRKTALNHYCIEKALQYTQSVLVCRVTPDDSYISNSSIRRSTSYTTVTANTGYIFTHDSIYVDCQKDYDDFNQIDIGDWIFHENDDVEFAAQVVSKEDTLYEDIYGEARTSTSTTSVITVHTIHDVSGVYLATDTARTGINYYIGGSFNSATKTITLGTALPDTNTDVIVDYTAETGSLRFKLDRKYQGAGGTGDINKTQPFLSVPVSVDVTDEDDFDLLDIDAVFYFYAVGSGSYYNNIKIKGVRNTQLEKMFMDKDGNVLYKYIFMDIGIYEILPDGSEKLLEGPWTVSLIRRTKENEVVRDQASGRVLYIEDVINENSKFVRVISAGGDRILVHDVNAEDNRLKVMLLLSVGSPNDVGNIAYGGIILENGTDGTVDAARSIPLYNNLTGDIQLAEGMSDRLLGDIRQAYTGELQSVDGSIALLQEYIRPVYKPDYIVCGGYPAYVQSGAIELTQIREDCLCLADTGKNYNKVSDDINARLNSVPWNTWTAMLYVQYRKVFDDNTGEWIWMTPVYHAIGRHLYVDSVYFIAEPVANIEKGAIEEKIVLAYQANHTERGDLGDHELNYVVVEPNGKYLNTQYTTWKRFSVLKRAHVAKFIMYCRQEIPSLLSDILQRKGTSFWINQARTRIVNFLNQFVENENNERYSVLSDFEVNVEFDDVYSELNVYISMKPIRAIERINVHINVI